LVEGTDNVVPCRSADGGEEEFFDRLSPLLAEAVRVPGDESSRSETNNVLSLLDENARLRALAVKLSNVVGDLPSHFWQRRDDGDDG
jgi:hypothetical protein